MSKPVWLINYFNGVWKSNEWHNCFRSSQRRGEGRLRVIWSAGYHRRRRKSWKHSQSTSNWKSRRVVVWLDWRQPGRNVITWRVQHKYPCRRGPGNNSRGQKWINRSRKFATSIWDFYGDLRWRRRSCWGNLARGNFRSWTKVRIVRINWHLEG